jgi:hypothetical protein
MTWARRLAILILCCLACTLMAEASNTLPAGVYGPAVFSRNSRNITTGTANFSLPQLVYGPFTLFVSAPSHQAVAVELNGNPVFGNGVGTSPETVTLEAENTLNIILPNGLGESVTITIMGYQYAYTSFYQMLEANVPLPFTDDIDWRSKGVVTPVQDEGSCESDWAFSATGAAEGMTAVTTGLLPNLSAQELIDCIPRRPMKCGNANPVSALKYILQNGDERTSDYPYTGRVGVCQAGSATPVPPAFSTIQWLHGESALVAAVNRGPVSVVINSNWFAKYKGGVAFPDCTSAPPIFTAALVVGYTSQVWIVKTSMGTGWGAGGYFYLARGANLCGVGDFGLALGN